MNKKIINLSFIFTLFLVGFSGCTSVNQKQIDTKKNHVEENKCYTYDNNTYITKILEDLSLNDKKYILNLNNNMLLNFEQKIEMCDILDLDLYIQKQYNKKINILTNEFLKKESFIEINELSNNKDILNDFVTKDINSKNELENYLKEKYKIEIIYVNKEKENYNLNVSIKKDTSIERMIKILEEKNNIYINIDLNYLILYIKKYSTTYLKVNDYLNKYSLNYLDNEVNKQIIKHIDPNNNYLIDLKNNILKIDGSYLFLKDIKEMLNNPLEIQNEVKSIEQEKINFFVNKINYVENLKNIKIEMFKAIENLEKIETKLFNKEKAKRELEIYISNLDKQIEILEKGNVK